MKAVLFILVLTVTLPLQAQEAADPGIPAGNPAGDPASEQPELSLDERLDALLEAAPDDEAYRQTSNCLSRRHYRSVKVLNQNYLLFYKNRTYWLNRVRKGCVALRRNKALTFTSHGSSVCRGDQVYVSDRLNLNHGFDGYGRPMYYEGICFLGEFETISAEQAVLLSEVSR